MKQHKFTNDKLIADKKDYDMMKKYYLMAIENNNTDAMNSDLLF